MIRKAPVGCLRTRNDAASNKHLGCPGYANESRQHPVRLRIGNDAAASLQDSERSIGRNDAHVGLQRKREADADSGAVDGSNDRLANLPCPRRHRRRLKAIGVGHRTKWAAPW